MERNNDDKLNKYVTVSGLATWGFALGTPSPSPGVPSAKVDESETYEPTTHPIPRDYDPIQYNSNIYRVEIGSAFVPAPLAAFSGNLEVSPVDWRALPPQSANISGVLLLPENPFPRSNLVVQIPKLHRQPSPELDP